jgi:hypothetical protein
VYNWLQLVQIHRINRLGVRLILYKTKV